MQTSRGLLQNSQSGNAIRYIDISRRRRNRLVPSDLKMANKFYVHSRKRNVSNYRMGTDKSQGHERSRHEIRGISGRVFATYSETADLNYDKALEINATSQMTFQHNRFAGIDHEFQTNKESPSHNVFAPCTISLQLQVHPAFIGMSTPQTCPERHSSLFIRQKCRP
ncbi:hypothetical protein AVEN_85079-1 [Araneus ventricosus]|uniref:Uncharacterized protein n=1 Tax=Araneus ventricosus TaxID=182803 RepID=A0A4Y2V596_ARAVE|nr:hypothetical protein AVEN_85079-1 [Araneus ventricosus]